MGQPNNEDLIQMAMRTAKSGQKSAARMMLNQVYNRDKRNERVLVGLAQLATNNQERRKWLKLALKENPRNEKAQAMLQKIEYERLVRQNQMLMLWGTVAAVLTIIVIGVVIVIIAT